MSMQAFYSVTQLAALLNVDRRAVLYQIRIGALRTMQPGGSRGKHLIAASVIRERFPDVWESLAMVRAASAEYDDDEP